MTSLSSLSTLMRLWSGERLPWERIQLTVSSFVIGCLIASSLAVGGLCLLLMRKQAVVAFGGAIFFAMVSAGHTLATRGTLGSVSKNIPYLVSVLLLVASFAYVCRLLRKGRLR